MVVCLMAMTSPAHAQGLKLGIKGGYNLSSVDTNIEGLKKNSMGFFIGPMAEFTIPGFGIGADAALMYAQRGKDELKMEGLEVPINLKFTFGAGSTLSIFLVAGPDFFFNFKDIDLNALDETYSAYKANDKTAQVGFNVGGGIKLLKHLQVGINYCIPLGSSFTFKNVVDGVQHDAKYNTWQLTAAVTF